MAYSQDQQTWLDTISQYIDPEASQSIAENLYNGDHLLTDQPTVLVDQLVGLDYLYRQSDGRHIVKYPGSFLPKRD